MKSIKKIHQILAAALTAFGAHASADVVTDWNANASAIAAAACITPAPDGNPLYESHLYAMVHLAIFDAVNSIQPRSKPYAFSGRAPAKASLEAAVARAAYEVLANRIPKLGVPEKCVAAGLDKAAAEYKRAMSAIPDGQNKTDGVATGHATASAIIQKRENDGSAEQLVDPNYPQGKMPGEWRFTPGSPPVAFGPKWGAVKPFALKSAEQFRPAPPLAVSCSKPDDRKSCELYAKDVEEIRRLGSDGVSAPSARTPDQTQIAVFWLESSPFSWNRIARQISEANKFDTHDNARMFALLNVAQADGYIASWATKFHYKFWRPITAIREAANDDNPGTTGDVNWMSLVPTPPVPDYESAHAVQGAAAAEVIRSIVGPRGTTAFSNCSNALPERNCASADPVLRKFEKIEDAATENGESRILVGYHFRDAVNKGLKEGRQIAEWAVEHILKPSQQQ